jgi:hypothetical protein
MPDTLPFLILGLLVTVLIFGGFIATMLIRQRNLNKDIELIKQLAEDE